MGSRAMSYFHWKYNQLSSALRRFTVLFGMGRSGTTPLWSPGQACCLVPAPGPHLTNSFRCHKASRFVFADLSFHLSNKLYGYRIKPYEQLVSVSLTSHNASTPDLSTSWSRTTLQGGLASGKTYLQAGFPLRCFQRLSLPDIATRQCDWHHNRYTSGPSTPVLSY